MPKPSMMSYVHLHFIIRVPCPCDEAIARVYSWLPWVLLREHFRRAGAVHVSVSSEAA